MGWRIGKVFGIEVRAPAGWLVILPLVGFIAWSQLTLDEPQPGSALDVILAAICAVAFFVCSTAHDLAHSVVARRRGMPVTSIAVSFFGGANPLDPTAERPKDDLVIALVGPLVSLGIGAVVAAVAAVSALAGGPVLTVLAETLAVIAGLNFILGLANLVPAYPLDGGRVVRALGWWRGGTIDRGWRWAASLGRLVGYLFVGIGLLMFMSGPVTNGAMTVLAGWFLVLSSRSIADRLRVNRLIGGLHVQDAMETEPVSVGPHLTVDTFAEQLLDTESEMTAVPVVSEGSVVGILGARQLRRLQRRLWPTTRVEDVMAKASKLPVLSALDELEGAVERLYRTGLDGLPVMDGGALVGILTRRSVGKVVHERGLAIGEGRTPA
jgi:Zn-dependent protease/CBS domain-containing protein